LNMTQATIELTAAIIGLIAVIIQVTRSLFKWAHGKGILGVVISLAFSFLALVCYLSAVAGMSNHWSAGLVSWLLLAFVVFVALAFCTNSGIPGRLEITLFVVLIAAGVTLSGTVIFAPKAANQTPAATAVTSPSPTPSSN
jgi:hypothetical protein